MPPAGPSRMYHNVRIQRVAETLNFQGSGCEPSSAPDSAYVQSRGPATGSCCRTPAMSAHEPVLRASGSSGELGALAVQQCTQRAQLLRRDGGGGIGSEVGERAVGLLERASLDVPECRHVLADQGSPA